MYIYMYFIYESIYCNISYEQGKHICRDKLDSQNDSKYKQQELLWLMS